MLTAPPLYAIIPAEGVNILNFWQDFLRILDISMEKPELYGWFHLLSLGLTVAFTVFLCLWSKGRSHGQIRKMILVVTFVVMALELYKQINFSFSYEGGIVFDYQWYAFPFQFCSTPMYIGLLAGLTRKGKVHEAANAYLATYAIFAGICVMLYPSTVFIDTIGINIQTMVCHGTMISVGVCLLYSGYVKLEHKSILKAMAVFAICVALAATMNEVAHLTGLLERESFDMFYISPYGQPSLPVYSLVQAAVPFPLCLITYVCGFSLASYLILLAAMGIQALGRKIKGAKPVKQTSAQPAV